MRITMFFLTILVSTMTQAAVPAFIPYSGRLSDGTAWGQSTTLDLVLTLYDAQEDGTVVFQGKHLGAQVVDGYFTVNLGMCDAQGACDPNPANATFPSALTDGLWLGVAADDRPELPKAPVGSVPYAIACSNASALAGQLPGHYATAASVADLSAELSADYYAAAALDGGALDGRYVNADGDSMAGSLALPANGLKAGGTQFALANGYVGIGTGSPEAALHVSGGRALFDATITDANMLAGGGQLRVRSQDHPERALALGYNDTGNYGFIQANEAGASSAWRNLALEPAGGWVGVAGIKDPKGYLHINAGTDDWVFQFNNELNFSTRKNSPQTWNINYRGYDGGATQPRSLNISDGKFGSIAFFDGTTGRVGIGAGGSPSYRLHVAGTSGWTNALVAAVGSGDTIGLGIYNNTSKWDIANIVSGTYKALQFENNNGITFEMRADGDLVVPANVRAASSVYAGGVKLTSTRTAKTSIVTTSTGDQDALLAALEATDVVRYRYKTEPDSRRLHVGVIAEEAPEEILSEDGKSVSLGDWSGVLTASVKALARWVHGLEAEGDDLRAENLRLRAQVEAMGRRLDALEAASGRRP